MISIRFWLCCFLCLLFTSSPSAASGESRINSTVHSGETTDLPGNSSRGTGNLDKDLVDVEDESECSSNYIYYDDDLEADEAKNAGTKNGSGPPSARNTGTGQLFAANASGENQGPSNGSTWIQDDSGTTSSEPRTGRGTKRGTFRVREMTTAPSLPRLRTTTAPPDGTSQRAADLQTDEEEGDEMEIVISQIIVSLSYVALVICPLGLLGNVLQFINMQVSRRGEVVGALLRVLAVSDSCVLVVELFRAVLHVAFEDIYFASPPPGLCDVVFCLYTFARYMSSFALVVMCLDRLMAIATPLKRARYVTTSRVWLAEGLALVLSLLLTFAHYVVLLPFSPTVCNHDILIYCWTASGFIDEGMLIYVATVSNILLSSFLPALVLLVINIVIIAKLRSHLRAARALYGGQSTGATTLDVKPLVLVSVLGCLTLLPIALMDFLYYTFRVPVLTTPVEVVFRALELVYLIHFSEPFYILILCSRRYRSTTRFTWQRVCGCSPPANATPGPSTRICRSSVSTGASSTSLTSTLSSSDAVCRSPQT